MQDKLTPFGIYEPSVLGGHKSCADYFGGGTLRDGGGRRSGRDALCRRYI